MRDNMNHVLLLYNQDLAIFREALETEVSSRTLSLRMRLREAKGGTKILLSTEDLTLIYNGMSLLELSEVEHKHSDEAALKQRGGSTHAWGNDPIGRFRNWQQFILARV